MSKWILESHTVYKDGTEYTGYYKAFPLGMFLEMTDRKDDAKKFDTKKEALEFARGFGRKWTAVKIE